MNSKRKYINDSKPVSIPKAKKIVKKILGHGVEVYDTTGFRNSYVFKSGMCRLEIAANTFTTYRVGEEDKLVICCYMTIGTEQSQQYRVAAYDLIEYDNENGEVDRTEVIDYESYLYFDYKTLEFVEI